MIIGTYIKDGERWNIVLPDKPRAEFGTSQQRSIDMNSVTLVGNLGADPELKYLQDGTAVCNLRVCTSEKWTDKRTGEAKEKSEWHNVVVWGQEAETLAQAARVGTRVMIAGGSLETREYDSREGEKRYVTEVIVRWPRGQIGIVPRSDAQQGGRPAQAGGYTDAQRAQGGRGYDGGRRGPHPGERDRPTDDFGGYGPPQPPRGRGGMA